MITPTRESADWSGPATVVQIDLDYRTVGKNRDISMGIVGDAGAILSGVTQAASGRIDNGARRREEWLRELREQENKSVEAMRPRLFSDANPIHPLRLAQCQVRSSPQL